MKVSILLITFLIAINISGQGYGNVWQFGSHVGLDFNDCGPVVIYSNNSGFESCASIADENGQLLFYTNSDTIWNADHELMSNGALNFSFGTLSQVLIIPKPENTSTYYVITTQIQGGDLSLQYHEVNMNLDGGLGEVVDSNVEMLQMTVTEQICATWHANGTDILLLTHEYGTNSFVSFLVTANGIDLNPVISNAGPDHGECLGNCNARGEIKFSPDGSHVAFNGNGIGMDDETNLLCLLDFDNSNGTLSNAINLPFSRGDFGLSFSPDNTKLYGATWKAFGFSLEDHNYLYQFDLSSNDPETIINSKTVVDSLSVPKSYGTIKIGPDGKVYVRQTNHEFLGVIQSPNEPGSSCDYNPDGIDIGEPLIQYGLNNYIEYVDYCTPTSIEADVSPVEDRKLVKIIDLMGREAIDEPLMSHSNS